MPDLISAGKGTINPSLERNGGAIVQSTTRLYNIYIKFSLCTYIIPVKWVGSVSSLILQNIKWNSEEI